jgi:ABC-type proline/glycine betaine transport system substrate-binding protein
MNKLLFAVAIALSLLTPSAAQAQKALTNDDVVRLSKVGLGDEVVIAKIRQAEDVDFKLELDDLTKLKQAGLDDVPHVVES